MIKLPQFLTQMSPTSIWRTRRKKDEQEKLWRTKEEEEERKFKKQRPDLRRQPRAEYFFSISIMNKVNVSNLIR